MSQTPHPHDPYADESADAPQQGAPSSDPSLHPHDPYAYDSAAGGDPLDIDAPAPQPEPAPPVADPYAAPGGAPHTSHAQQPPHGAQAPYGSGPAQGENVPLSGEALSPSDSRLWATLAQAAVAAGHVISWGFLGWVGPLVVYLMYKDRDRFVRFHAAEALNGAIAVFIAQVALTIAITIVAVFTFGIGTVLYPLAGLPALLQLVFSIIGAVKANRGEYWKYPFNIRLVK